MSNATMPVPSEMRSLFAHENLPLFRRARALHAYAAQLALEPGSATTRRALKRAAKSAFVTIAAAGTADSPRACEHILRRARTWLARCSAEVAALLDEGEIGKDVARFARQLVGAVGRELASLPTEVALGFPPRDGLYDDEHSLGHVDAGADDSEVEGSGTEHVSEEPTTSTGPTTSSQRAASREVGSPQNTSTVDAPRPTRADDGRQRGPKRKPRGSTAPTIGE